MKTKICYICKTIQSIDNFNKDKTRKDGLVYLCKTCSKIRNKFYNDSHKEQAKKWLDTKNPGCGLRNLSSFQSASWVLSYTQLSKQSPHPWRVPMTPGQSIEALAFGSPRPDS